jgi:RNA-binding protein
MLTSKQRSFLKSLGSQVEVVLQAGKAGIGEALIKQADDALEARELIKMRVLRTCPDDPAETAARVAAAVGADVVQTLGRNSLLFRRSSKPCIELPD